MANTAANNIPKERFEGSGGVFEEGCMIIGKVSDYIILETAINGRDVA